MSQKHDKPHFTKFDPAHLLDGVFVPCNGIKRGRLLTPMRDFGEHKVQFRGPWQLSAFDQSLLLAASAEIGRHSSGIRIGPTSGPISQQLLLNLEPKKNESRDPLAKAAMAPISLRRLLLNAGYVRADQEPSGRLYQLVAESFDRMRATTVRDIGPMPDGTMADRSATLVSAHMEPETRQIYIAVSPRLSEALLGDRHFVTISLFERACIETEAGKILHAWLCSTLRPGAWLGGQKRTRVAITSLISHVFGPTDELDDKALYRRRKAIKTALKEITGLHEKFGPEAGMQPWTVEIEKTHVAIRRPSEMPRLEAMSGDTLGGIIERAIEEEEEAGEPPY